MSEPIMHPRVERFVSYRDGWDSYDAPAPSAKAIAYAGELLKLLDALGKGKEFGVFPFLDGGITIEHVDGPEIVVHNDGHIVFESIE